MSIIQTIVLALAAGAVAAVEATASQAVKDGYTTLKTYLQRKYQAVDVAQLEKQPASPRRRALLAEELGETPAATDRELLTQAQQLLELIATDAPAAAQVIGIDLADIRGASLQLSDVVAQGMGAVTGVKVKGATIAGAIEISGVRAGQTPPAPKPATSPSLKILFLAASPEDQVLLHTAAEARAIDLALRQAEQRNIELIHHGAVQVDDLQPLLFRHQPHLVHFSGHGSSDHAILLQTADGQSAAVTGTALRDLFQLGQARLRCVVLNACYTEEQASAIAEVVDCVVGMSDAISDDAAQLFATAFYGALGAGQAVKTAFAAGCNRIDLSNLAEQHKPVLKAWRADPATIHFVT